MVCPSLTVYCSPTAQMDLAAAAEEDVEEEQWGPSLQLAIAACVAAVTFSFCCSCWMVEARKRFLAGRSMRRVNHMPRVSLLSEDDNED